MISAPEKNIERMSPAPVLPIVSDIIVQCAQESKPHKKEVRNGWSKRRQGRRDKPLDQDPTFSMELLVKH